MAHVRCVVYLEIQNMGERERPRMTNPIFGRVARITSRVKCHFVLLLPIHKIRMFFALKLQRARYRTTKDNASTTTGVYCGLIFPLYIATYKFS